MDSVSVAGENIHPVALKKKMNRSRVTNGAKLLPLTDGRSAAYRRFKDVFEEVCSDLGGLAYLTEGQRQLAKRAALLSAELERQEAFWAREERTGPINWRDEPDKFDPNLYGVLCDRLGRLFDRLGLERRARPLNNPIIEHFGKPPERPAP
jgi:hypothetical protein